MGSGVQFFPQVVAPSTFLGRLASGAGPVEAIPFSSLAAAISGTPGALTVTTLTATTSVVTPQVTSAAATNFGFGANAGVSWTVDQATNSFLSPVDDNTRSLGDPTHRIKQVTTLILTASTSVATPLVQANAVALTLEATGANFVNLKTNGANRVQIDGGGNTYPIADNAQQLGGVANRWSVAFTPVIDSGTTGSLSLRTNNGQQGFSVANNGTVVNNLEVYGSNTGVGNAVMRATGGDTNITATIQAKGSGGIGFQTDWTGAAPIQFQVLHTAGATRNITITGSNGGNPTLGTTAGSIKLGPGQLQFPASQLASADANTLDDYAEVTWIPSLGGNTTYTSRSGTYTKIGNLVFIKGSIVVNAIGTGSTTNISGLPFTANGGVSFGISCGFFATLATSVVAVFPFVQGGATTIQVSSLTAAAANQGTSAIFGNGTTFEFAGCYQTT